MVWGEPQGFDFVERIVKSAVSERHYFRSFDVVISPLLVVNWFCCSCFNYLFYFGRVDQFANSCLAPDLNAFLLNCLHCLPPRGKPLKFGDLLQMLVVLIAFLGDKIMIKIQWQLGIELIPLLETKLRVFLLHFHEWCCKPSVRDEHRTQWILRIESIAGQANEVTSLRFLLPHLPLLL